MRNKFNSSVLHHAAKAEKLSIVSLEKCVTLGGSLTCIDCKVINFFQIVVVMGISQILLCVSKYLHGYKLTNILPTTKCIVFAYDVANREQCTIFTFSASTISSSWSFHHCLCLYPSFLPYYANLFTRFRRARTLALFNAHIYDYK